MKSTLTSRGRTLNLKAATWKVGGGGAWAGAEPWLGAWPGAEPGFEPSLTKGRGRGWGGALAGGRGLPRPQNVS
jgi:hypothetical protein